MADLELSEMRTVVDSELAVAHLVFNLNYALGEGLPAFLMRRD